MSEPTKEELLAFMRKHGPEKVDSITDTESAIRHFRCTSKVYKQQRDQYKTERDTLIDDLSWYKAKVSRLEREKEKRRGEITSLCEIVSFFYNTGEIKDNLLSEFSQHIGNKPSSSTYKYFRAKLDNLNITEDK